MFGQSLISYELPGRMLEGLFFTEGPEPTREIIINTIPSWMLLLEDHIVRFNIALLRRQKSQNTTTFCRIISSISIAMYCGVQPATRDRVISWFWCRNAIVVFTIFKFCRLIKIIIMIAVNRHCHPDFFY